MSYRRTCRGPFGLPSSSKSGSSPVGNSLSGGNVWESTGWDGARESTVGGLTNCCAEYGDRPRDSFVVYVYAVGAPGGAGAGTCEVSSSLGAVLALFRRYGNQRSKASKMIATPAPTPTPAAAPGESPGDEFWDGVSAGDSVEEVGEDVDKDEVGGGLVDSYATLIVANYGALGAEWIYTGVVYIRASANRCRPVPLVLFSTVIVFAVKSVLVTDTTSRLAYCDTQRNHSAWL